MSDQSSNCSNSGSSILQKRKRSFSETFGRSSPVKSTADELAAKYNERYAQNPMQIQEIVKESTHENDSQSSNPGGNTSNDEDSKSKGKKVTQAQMMGKTAGRWTKEEHKKFVQAIKLYGKDWKKVEEYVQTRSGAQIRSHAQKYFIRIQKKLKGNSATYLNQTEDQCSTSKGLELFRQTISLYEEGVKDDVQDEDDELSQCLNSLKRQKTSTNTLLTLAEPDCFMLSKQSLPLIENFNFTSDKSQEMTSQESPLNRLIQQSQQQQQQNVGKDLHHQQLQILAASLQDSQSQASTALSPDNRNAASGSLHSQQSNNHNFFLSNERKQIHAKFLEIVKRKELIMADIYFNDKTDLFNDGRKYITYIQDILNDIQKLSQKLTIINQISGLLDPSSNTTSLLERLLILINEVVNLQKILTEIVSNNETFNKPLARATTPAPSIFQAPTTTPQQLASLSQSSYPLPSQLQQASQQQQQTQPQNATSFLNLMSQLSPQHSQTFVSQNAQQASVTQLFNSQSHQMAAPSSQNNNAILSQLSALLNLQQPSQLFNNSQLKLSQCSMLPSNKPEQTNMGQKIKSVQIIQGNKQASSADNTSPIV